MLLIALLIPLGMAILVYLTVLARTVIAARAAPMPEAMLAGAVVNFLSSKYWIFRAPESDPA